MAISVLNTDAGLSGKTIANTEDAQTITGLKTFDRDPNPPFAVSSGSAVVPNLDADKVDGIEGTDLVKKDGTVAMTGTLDLGTIGKIQFPATQSASAGANVLDDYEEGTWSPTIIGTGGQSGQAYSLQSGYYVKVGKLVFVHGRVTLSTLGTVTTTAAIGNLPFTSDNTQYSTGNIGFFSNMTTSFVSLTLALPPNTTRLELFGLTAAGTGHGALVQGDLSNTTSIIFSATYIASA